MMKLQNIIEWIACIWGGISLGFLLFMLFGHLFSEGGLGPFGSNKEIIGFICFPISTIFGLILAYRRSLYGGLIVMIGALVIYVMMPSIQASLFIHLITFPGVLYVVSHLLKQKRTTQSGPSKL